MNNRIVYFIIFIIIISVAVSWSPAGTKDRILAVPFIAQKSMYECGVAALLSLLTWNHHAVDYQDLKKKIYSESAKGTFPISIELYLRKNKIPYTAAEGNLVLLQELINKEIPSIALLKKTIVFQEINHYYVVVGIEKDMIVVHDGNSANQKLKTADFLSHWSKSNYWLLYLNKNAN
jgi:ABC-type bacteriocin/lantibiotic exporter with double-glycine peptidase domain